MEFHERCPQCGKLNSPLEGMGSGRCNECIDKRVGRFVRAITDYEKARQKKAQEKGATVQAHREAIQQTEWWQTHPIDLDKKDYLDRE